MTAYNVHWGVIGCGWISSMFVKDIALDRPDVTDIVHSIVAVGSRDITKANRFIADFCPDGGCGQIQGYSKTLPQAVGSYDEIFNHPDVQIVYIGTLHPSHYTDALSALQAGKHVLVEKPACLNAKEWAALSTYAKSRNLFLMEGLWTKFQPITQIISDKLHIERAIGSVRHVKADFSMPFNDTLSPTHRTLSLQAAGGPLFDLGAYILLPAILALRWFCELKSPSGVDLSTTIVLGFRDLKAQAVLTTSHAYSSPRDERCLIVGTHGELVYRDGLSRITKIGIKRVKGEPMFPESNWQEEETIERSYPGFGLQFEADAVGRDLRDGRVENAVHTHGDTLFIMKIMDTVRQQGGYVLPEGLEKV